jgi:RND superfamily putative drug exporter
LTGPLYRFSQWNVRHAKWTLGVWAVVAVGIILFANSIGRITNDDLSIPGSDSTHATNTLDRYLPNQANGSNPVVLETTDGSRLDDSTNTTTVKATVKSLEANQYVHDATSPLSEAGSDNLSKDGQTGFIAVTLTLAPDQLDDEEADEIIAAADPAKRGGLRVSIGGYLGQEVSNPATESSEAIGLGVAVIVLLFAFGTAVAMSLPIITALFGLGTGLALIGIAGHVISVPSIAPTLATMLGLGVGIDYALFIVTRHLGFLKDGHPPAEAAARAAATAGGAVLFAGSTVVVALLALYFGGIPLVRALGYSSAIVVAVAIVAALTLLPALLGLVGERIHKGRFPLAKGAHDDGHPHGWNRWAHFVGRHPWPAAITGILILVVLAIPLLDITLGQPDNSQMPTDTQTRKSYDALANGFSAGATGPMLVAVHFEDPAKPDTKKLNKLEDQQKQQEQQAQNQYEQAAQQAALAGEPPPPEPAGPTKKQQQETDQQEAFLKSNASDPRLVKLQNQIAKDGDVYSVSPAKVEQDGNAAVFSVTSNSSPSSQATRDLVSKLRDETIPDAEGKGMTTYLDGQTAAYVDLAERIGEKLPLVIAIVVSLAFLLLMLAFRSLVVPLTAGLMNLLSVGAAYGVLVAVFEKGWGLSLIGLDHTLPVVSFVPLLMFAILFGLSMDYQVFLLTRMQEHWRAEHNNHDAVVEGLAGTARVITSAALIMVAVFTSFVLNGDPTVKQFGVGLAVAIAIDATVVRTLLVPAVMIIFGKSNWWLPGFLDRHMPNLGIEGDEYFEALDREEQKAPAAGDAATGG